MDALLYWYKLVLTCLLSFLASLASARLLVAWGLLFIVMVGINFPFFTRNELRFRDFYSPSTMWPFRRNTLPGKYSRDCLTHAQRTWSCSRWCCCHCCCCYCYCCYYCCCYCCCLLTHSPERNWFRKEKRLLTTVFTVIRRKLKNEEMEKQFDPKTLEKRYNACNGSGMKTLIRNRRL